MDQNIPGYNEAQLNQPYPQYQGGMNAGGGGVQRAAHQYVNQLNYANMYNQNLMYQQQYQLEMQNQQLAQVAQEREDLQRQLIQQRQFAAQARQRQAVNSRQKEMDALAMLAGFQRSLGGGRTDPLSLFDDTENMLTEPGRGRTAKNRNYNDYAPPSRDPYQKPTTASRLLDRPYGGNLDQGAYGYSQPQPYQSPFQNAANLMINPMSPAPYQNMYQTGDPYMGQNYPQDGKKTDPGSRTAEILMASLEKQNQILAELTGTINKDRDWKVVAETKEIEEKIKQMEFESQAKQYQLFNHNTFDALSRNYNRPIQEINLQKSSSLMPGVSPNLMTPAQLLQLQAIMGPNRFMPFGSMPPVSVMPSEMMKHQEKLQEKKEKERAREKKKKNKLKELLLLLGEEEDGGDEEDEVVQSRAPREDKRGTAKKQDPDLKALNDEKAKLAEEKKRKKEEEAKKKRQNKLRALMWLRVYPLMYYVDFYDKKNQARKEAYAVLSERIGTNMENTKIWATKATAKGFEMVTGNAKLNLAIVPFGGKKIPQKDLDARPPEIQKILKSLMDGLINNTKAELLPAQLLSFLGDISQDYTFPPQNYLFAFEVNRLDFTHSASLKETTPAKVQMICSMFMLVRMFIAEMLLQPDKINTSVKPTEGLIRNVKTLASILMIVITEYLNARMTIRHQNQKHLEAELAIKPRSSPIAFNSPVDLKEDGGEEEGASKKKELTDSVIITSLYTKEQLNVYFGKKPLVDEVKALIEGWCNSISEIVTLHHAEEVKAKKANKK